MAAVTGDVESARLAFGPHLSRHHADPRGTCCTPASRFGWNFHLLSRADAARDLLGLLQRLLAIALSDADDAIAKARRAARCSKIGELDQNALALADGIDPKVHGGTLRSIQTRARRRRVRGCARATTPTPRSPASAPRCRARNSSISPAARNPARPSSRWSTSSRAARTIVRPKRCASSSTWLSRKKSLACASQRDTQEGKALMEIWLYFHVPLSFTTVAALFARPPCPC